MAKKKPMGFFTGEKLQPYKLVIFFEAHLGRTKFFIETLEGGSRDFFFDIPKIAPFLALLPSIRFPSIENSVTKLIQVQELKNYGEKRCFKRKVSPKHPAANCGIFLYHFWQVVLSNHSPGKFFRKSVCHVLIICWRNTHGTQDLFRIY